MIERIQQKIPGYRDYTVTPIGEVRSTKLRRTLMKHQLDKNGYHRIMVIGDSGGRKGVYVHQMVASTYIPNPENKKFVNHKDHDKSNNSISNLEWVTHLENIQHDWAMGKRKPLPGGENNATAKYSNEQVRKVRHLRKQGYTLKQIDALTGVKWQTVQAICAGRLRRNG